MKSFKLFLDQITEAAKKKKPNIDGDGDTGESMKDAADNKDGNTEESMKDAADDKEEDKKDDKKDK